MEEKRTPQKNDKSHPQPDDDALHQLPMRSPSQPLRYQAV